MQTYGAHVTMAKCAGQALSLLAHASREGRAFDLVLLDMMMPEMSGLEMAHRVPDLNLKVAPKIILLSSIADRLSKRELRESSIDAYLTKPVKPSAFREALLKVFNHPQQDSCATSEVKVISNAELLKHLGRKLRVLLVEDNIINQKFGVRLLRSMGVPLMLPQMVGKRSAPGKKNQR